MVKYKDPFILGAIAGIVSNSVVVVLNYLSYLLNFNEYFIWRLAASAFIATAKNYGITALIVGAVADYTVAASLGLIVITVLNNLGYSYAILKGVFVGLLYWILLFAILFNSGVVKLVPEKPSSYLVYVLTHILLGGLASWIIVRINGGHINR